MISQALPHTIWKIYTATYLSNVLSVEKIDTNDAKIEPMAQDVTEKKKSEMKSSNDKLERLL